MTVFDVFLWVLVIFAIIVLAAISSIIVFSAIRIIRRGETRPARRRNTP